jgi:ATP/maltotriose-dependent transcriptional regulator MalT
MTEAEINAAFSEKVQRGMFAPIARFLTNADTAEDRMQEALALTWEMYRDRIVNRDVVLDDAILVHACRQRAVDLGRTLVRAGGTRRLEDALDPRAYQRGRVEVLRLDAWVEDDSEDEGHPHQLGLAEEFCSSPERKLNSAIDLEDWLDGLSARDYGIMEGRMAGFSLPRIATDLGLSTSTVFTKAKKLGLELASRAGIHIHMERERSGRDRQRQEMLDAE